MDSVQPSEDLYLAFQPAQERYQSFRDRASKLQALLHAELSLILHDESYCIDRLESRTKDFSSIRDNIVDKYGVPDEPLNLPKFLSYAGDVIGLRVVVYYDSDVSRVARIVHAATPEATLDEKLTTQDLSRGARFGYRAAHVNFYYSDAKRIGIRDVTCLGVEIQVRTILSDAWARHSHKLAYVSGPKPSSHVLRKFAASAALIEQVDESIELTRGFVPSEEDSQELNPVAYEVQWIQVEDEIRDRLNLKISEADLKGLFFLLSSIEGWKNDQQSISAFFDLIKLAWNRFGSLQFSKYGFQESLTQLKICIYGIDKSKYKILLPIHLRSRVSDIVEVGDRGSISSLSV